MNGRRGIRWWAALGAAATVAGVQWAGAGAVERPDEAKWYLSGGLGQLQYEGDEEVDDGFLGTVTLGYDYSEWWTLEGHLFYAPQLDEQTVGVTEPGRPQYRMSRLDGLPAGEGDNETYAVGTALDALFHFTRWERLDPYLALGGGLTFYGDDLGDDNYDLAVRVGGGTMYHFNDEWAVRVDGRGFIAGENTEANAILWGGVVWNWGARLPPNYVSTDGPQDSDGDGLSDKEEGEIGTDPYNPDTDGDALKDGEEVRTYKTDPLNEDTDFDGLLDGAEVHTYQTVPTDRDTDDGGVADGHEVIEDHTDPREGYGSDDLLLFELYIQFDWDKSVIKEQYFREIDIIGKVLVRHPLSTARIEGHADQNRKSKADHNKRLSQQRAQAVLDYLAQKHNIDRSRMSADGYGFSRPKAPNDPKTGNPVNRRVEVYIRGAAKSDAGLGAGEAPAPAP